MAVYAVFRRSLAPTPATAAVVSLLLWGVSRLYGAGHVVMGQMPIHIFAIMSGGLLAGYLLGGQVGRWALERRFELLLQYEYEPNVAFNYRLKQLRFGYKLERDTLLLTRDNVTETWKRIAESDSK